MLRKRSIRVDGRGGRTRYRGQCRRQHGSRQCSTNDRGRNVTKFPDVIKDKFVVDRFVKSANFFRVGVLSSWSYCKSVRLLTMLNRDTTNGKMSFFLRRVNRLVIDMELFLILANRTFFRSTLSFASKRFFAIFDHMTVTRRRFRQMGTMINLCVFTITRAKGNKSIRLYAFDRIFRGRQAGRELIPFFRRQTLRISSNLRNTRRHLLTLFRNISRSLYHVCLLLRRCRNVF